MKGDILAFSLVVLVVTPSNVRPAPIDMIHPFRYDHAIQDAVPGGAIDRRSAIRRCVQHWGAYDQARLALFGKVEEAGYLNQPATYLLEVGNAGFGRYAYVLVANGRVRLGRDLARTGSDRGPREPSSTVRESLNAISDEELKDMRGDASSAVEDADCYFLTVTLKEGGHKQVAVYGMPHKAKATGRIIRALRPYLEEVHLGQPGSTHR